MSCMDNLLDLRTLAVVLMLISFALSAVMLYVWRSSKTYDGFGWWTAGTTAAAITFLAIAIIGRSNPAVTASLSSVAGTGSLLTAYLGVRKFFGRPMPYRTALAVWLVGTTVILWLTFIDPNVIIRITLVSLLVSAITFASGLEFKPEGDREARRVFRITRWSYGLFSLWMIVRTFLNVFPFGATSFFASNAGQAWTIAVYIVYNVFWTFNYLILNNQRLREDLENAKLELERQATTDFLTGVPNDRSFFEIGHKEFHRSVRFQYPLSVVMMDLDGFKVVNDRFGHARGDQVLKAAVDACTVNLRSSDTFARLGGDEFAMILAFTTEDNARILAENLREAVANSCEDIEFRITASFGVAEILSADTEIQNILDRADMSLYEAKRLGRDRVVRATKTVDIEELVSI